MRIPEDLPRLVVREVPGKGRGVFTLDPLVIGALIEVAPVLIFDVVKDMYRGPSDNTLDLYTFEWGKNKAALALGKASLFNHSYHPNVVYEMIKSGKIIRFIACRPITTNSELTINYNGTVNDMRPVGFDVA